MKFNVYGVYQGEDEKNLMPQVDEIGQWFEDLKRLCDFSLDPDKQLSVN